MWIKPFKMVIQMNATVRKKKTISQVLIFKQIILTGTIKDVLTIVWRIYVLIKGFESWVHLGNN